MTEAARLIVKLERGIDRRQPCCSNLARIEPGKGPHAGALICTVCGKWRGWLPKQVKTFLDELARTTGVASEPIIIRDAEHKQGDTAMQSSSFFPSKWFKAVDLGGQTRTVVIADVTEESFGADLKLALEFGALPSGWQPPNKPFVLNKTNWKVLHNAFGDETTGWLKQKISLSEITTTDPKGDMVQSIRLAIPKAAAPVKQAALKTEMDDFGEPDDKIPF